jgi:hypothetical protein
MSKRFSVTIKFVREYFATVEVRAESQEDADEKAVDLFSRDLFSQDDAELGLPRRWTMHDPRDHDPEIDPTGRCVDCGVNTLAADGEYYMVSDELWAAAGMGKPGGMLCLECLERRIGRPLAMEDFTAMVPSREAWRRHLARRRS